VKANNEYSALNVSAQRCVGACLHNSWLCCEQWAWLL